MADEIVEPRRVRVGMRAPLDIAVGNRRAELGLKPFEAGDAGRDLVRR
jgi:hypothetical protein